MSLPRGLRMSNWFSFTIIRKSDLVLVAEHRCENRKRQILASASSISYGQIVGWKLPVPVGIRSIPAHTNQYRTGTPTY